MPSLQHQWLLLWIARKMTFDGYLVGGYDGVSPHGGLWNRLPRPFEIARVRPDVWAISAGGQLALGEAKTAADVDTRHTRAQLLVLNGVRRRQTGQRCRIYFAAPRSAAARVDRVLIDVGLLRARHLVRIDVPDCLLEEHDRGEA
jgi:hypothetical protein